MSEKLILIDGHSILNRAFYGVPDLTNSEGLHTNAVYGFLNILFRILDEEQAQYLAVAFDLSAPTFRHKMYDAYKGTRKPMPEQLRQQVPVMKEMLTDMGVPLMMLEGYEADDLIGTVSLQAQNDGMKVSIISGDRDLLQLASDTTVVRMPRTSKGVTTIEDFYAKDVEEKYHITPEQVIELKALMGDASDNIPGLPGVGEKTATAIISQYGNIENAHEHAAEIKPPRASRAMMEHYDLAQLSKTLATINRHSPFKLDYEKARIGNLYTPQAQMLCRKLELKSLLGRFENIPEEKQEETMRILSDRTSEDEFLRKAADSEILGLYYLQKPALNSSVGAKLLGVAIAYADEKEGVMAGFIPLYDPFTSELICEKIRQMLTHSSGVLMDLKSSLPYLEGVPSEHLKDIGVGAYLLNPLVGHYPYEDVAKLYADKIYPSTQELIGKNDPEKLLQELTGRNDPEKRLQELGTAEGSGISTSDAEKPEQETDQTDRHNGLVTCACEQAITPLITYENIRRQLQDTGMLRLYEEVEMPLVYTLYEMQQAGIAVKGEELKSFGQMLTGRIEQLEKSIYEQAGEIFNINSPKQLGVILFEKLGMKGGKKTKTGYSTAADVLEKLAPDYPVVADILEYRQLTKLRSTYAEGLYEYIGADNRIHGTFNQTITATGRISSTEPNLQNIPVRTQLGRELRKVFVPKEGCVFVDADYSQIELRVLAHVSGDQHLIEAYKEAKDIHAITASQVFHTPLDQVTPLQRRNAKAVNFGIVYGISSFGLSQDLSISRKEAQSYIEQYFKTYPGIKAFLDKCVADAKEKGYSVTLFGRRRPVPELKSSNFAQRQFGERVAMNAPIQGTAADIIKIAMVRVRERMKKEQLRSQLVLQIHDELLVETYPEEVEKVQTILKEEMMGAADLAVPLEIDMHTGRSWYEAH